MEWEGQADNEAVEKSAVRPASTVLGEFDGSRHQICIALKMSSLKIGLCGVKLGCDVLYQYHLYVVLTQIYR